MTQTAENQERAERMEAVVYCYDQVVNECQWPSGEPVVDLPMDALGDEPETIVADMLADLRHFCDKHGLDFAELDRRAYENYREEK